MAFSSIDSPNFDDVVYDDNIVVQKVEAGFGTLRLLEIIDRDEVRATFDELKKLGRIEVSVQKLKPKGENLSKVTKYTFTAITMTGFLTFKNKANFSVETYTDYNWADGGPTKYEVSEIKFLD